MSGSQPQTASSAEAPLRLSKVSAKKAQEIYDRFELEGESVSLADDSHTPSQFLSLLIDHARYEDAVKFLAHSLPAREAVWWACVSARTMVNEGSGAEIRSAVEVAERWVYEPTEPNRRAAEKVAEKTNFRHPASWAAIAAFWSGGSVSDEGETPVPPPPYLYAHAVSGAVTLAAVLEDPDNAGDKFKLFLRQGVDIANGGNGQVS